MSKVKLGFLASGRGSNMHAIIDKCDQGLLAAVPAVVISNNIDAGALVYARERGLPGIHLSGCTRKDVDQAITDTLLGYGVDWVVLCGYMKRVGPALLQAFPERVVNVHPSLLPAYGGRGMYGRRVHEAVLKSGASTTGVTIHRVNEAYDQGEILCQREVPVRSDDTVESLISRVLSFENDIYWRVLDELISVSQDEIATG